MADPRISARQPGWASGEDWRDLPVDTVRWFEAEWDLAGGNETRDDGRAWAGWVDTLFVLAMVLWLAFVLWSS